MKEIKRRQISLFNLMVFLFSFAAVVIMTVNNIIRVNSLAAENNSLQNEIYRAVTLNNNLQTEIERLTTYENIKLRTDELGLRTSQVKPGKIVVEKNLQEIR
ncbi:MAG: hypothetical protein N2510_04390 [Ignavibacteria bacterium]|nr:hypothetical protein [Ignavibacteria bacterium]